MQEIITPTDQFPFELVIQYNKDQGPIGVGLQPRHDRPSLHFVDAVYGGVPSQTAIGKIFCENRYRAGVEDKRDFQTSDQEAEFYNQLGRDILDAVTGSAVNDGLWTWVDRSSTNRLVRLLRKARTIVYGKDE